MGRFVSKGKQLSLFESCFTTPQRRSYADLYQTFLETHAQSRYKPKTLEVHDTSSKHLLPFFGSDALENISAQEIEEYISLRKNQGVQNRTINIELTCLKCHLRQAQKWGFLEKNPFQFVTLLNEGPLRSRYCSHEELERLILASPPWLKGIISFAVSTGMRKNEILGLCWSQVKWEENLLILTETKTNQMRGVPLNETAKKVLLNQERFPGCPYVFVNPKTKTRWNTVTRTFQKACQKAGIDGLRFHDLRHTAASYLVQAGVEINVVREILGHKDLRMTLRYSHLSQKNRKEAVLKIDSFFLDKKEEVVVS